LVWLRIQVYTRIALGGAVTALGGGIVGRVLYGSTSLPAIALSGVAGAIVVRAFLRGEPPPTDA
jgi:hypothetical protein